MLDADNSAAGQRGWGQDSNDSVMGDRTMMALEALDAKKSKTKEVLDLYTKKRKKLQIAMFFLCYLSYGSVHVYREFWSKSKTVIEANEDKYHSDKEMLSDVDTVNFMVYGFTQFVTGAMGDAFDLKKVLPASYTMQAVCYALIAMTGFVGGEHAYVQFFFWFSILGLV